MARYLIRRIILAFVTIIGVTIVVFIASRLSGDVIYLILPQDATEAEAQALRVKLGLDQPIWIQYIRFVEGAVRGDFGESIRYQQPAMGIILDRVWPTIMLVSTAFLLAAAIGITFGIAAARWQGRWPDRTIRVLAVFGQSMPNFWTGMMAILIFAVWLGWLPTSGSRGLVYLIMPATVLAMFTAAAILRMTRTAMLETLDTEYVKFLRMKGVPERSVWWKHALRNSLVPLLALSGVQLANMLGGAVIVESVFSWPGLGSMMVEAVASRDYPLIQAGVIITSTFLVTLNLTIDMLFGVIDPRVRYA